MEELLLQIHKNLCKDFISVPFIYVDGKIFLDNTTSDEQRLVFYTAVGLHIKNSNSDEIIIAWDTIYGFSYYNLNSGKYVIVGNQASNSYEFPKQLINSLLYPPKVPNKTESFLLELLNEYTYL